MKLRSFAKDDVVKFDENSGWTMTRDELIHCSFPGTRVNQKKI